MNKQSESLRKNITKLLNNDQQTTQQFYLDMYRENIHQIRQEVNDHEKSDQLFQKVFLIWKRKLKQGRAMLAKMSDGDLEVAVFSLIRKIIHQSLLDINISAFYLLNSIKKNDAKAKEAISLALCNSQNLEYARYLTRSLQIHSLEGEDFLQESMVAMMTAIQKGRFILEGNQSNDIQVKKTFKYFREIIYRQIHKAYHREKSNSELNIDLRDSTPTEPITSGVEKLELAVYQSFHCLDQTSQKIMKYLMVDRISPKEVVKKINSASFPSTKDIVAHKIACLQKLRKLTAEKINDMDESSFDRYLEVCRNALKEIAEPCKTILQYFLPPLQKSYREIVQIIKGSNIAESEFLRTEDQVKRRKYKCMQALQDQIWQKLFTEIN